MRRCALAAALVLAATATPLCRGQEHAHDEAVDCGTRALYALLCLERGRVDLDAVRASLPERPAAGYSMRQLRDAARANGLRLVGVRLPGGEHAPDRPALAFLKVAPHGHYVVVRPVGQSGKLVQVIDSAKVHPEVLDAHWLYESPAWTGLALVPTRPNWRLRAGAGLAAGAALWLALRMRRPARDRS